MKNVRRDCANINHQLRVKFSKPLDIPILMCYHSKAVNNTCGEVSERFKELVLKTSDTATYRGFESHPLRHLTAICIRQLFGEIPNGGNSGACACEFQGSPANGSCNSPSCGV